MTTKPLDDLTGWIDVLKAATTEKTRIETVIAQARSKIEDALGDAEVGTIAGVPVVKWTTVTSSRFDQKAAREFLGDAAASFMTETTTRRFTLTETP